MNLIVICTDTFRAGYLGCYGNEWIQTPNIDALAADGVVFDNCYAEALPTLCARTVFYTGRHLWPQWQVREHRGDHLAYQPGWHQIPEEWPTLAEVLQGAGYTTALVSDLYHQFKPTGNWHRGFHSWQWIRGQEQDRYITGPRSRIDLSPYTRPGSYQRRRFQGLEQYLLNQLHRREESDYLCAQVLTTAAEWLKQNCDNAPFLLWCECFDPHEPWDPPKADADRYAPDYDGPEWISPPGTTDGVSAEELSRIRGLYAGECTLVDRWVGRLVEVVQSLGLWEESIIVFTSDHGTNLGERGLIRKRPWTLEQQEARLPLVVRHPQGPQGSRVDGLVHAPDIAPTLVQLLNVTPPETMTGLNAWPLATGDAGALHDEIVSAYGPYAALRNRDWLYTCRYSHSLGRAEDHPARLVRATDEMTDVSEQEAGVASEMRARLRRRCGQAWEVGE